MSPKEIAERLRNMSFYNVERSQIEHEVLELADEIDGPPKWIVEPMTNEKIVAILRDLTDNDCTLYGYKLQVRRILEALDPPKPQRPKPGTVVRFADDGDIGLVGKNGIAWVGPDGFVLISPFDKHRLEPVRILADDEVAVKRSQIQALLGEVKE